MNKQRINWTNTLFFIITSLVAVFGTLALAIWHPPHWMTLLLALGYTGATGLAITAGYHRLFSHQTYQASWPVKLFFLLFGAATFQGSVLEWSTDHRRHHLYTDTDEDPYSIKKGFWFAHIGWILKLDESKRDYSNVADLAADPLIAWQHRHCLWLSIFMGFILPMLLAALWGDAWGGLIIAGALRMTLNHHFTFFINSAAHYFGQQTYSDRVSALDNWFLSLFTYGEGYHNFHHQFALDYRNGVRWYHFDPSKWMIFSLSKLGLCRDLKRVSSKIIMQKRIEFQMKHLKQSNLAYIEDIITPVREHIKHLQDKLEKYKTEYASLKQQRINDCKKQLKLCQKRIKAVNKEIRYSFKAWQRIVQSLQIQYGTT